MNYVEDTDTPTEAARGVIIALRDAFRDMPKGYQSPDVHNAMKLAEKACDHALENL